MLIIQSFIGVSRLSTDHVLVHVCNSSVEKEIVTTNALTPQRLKCHIHLSF